MRIINLGLFDQFAFWKKGVVFAKKYSHLASCVGGLVTSGWAYHTARGRLKNEEEASSLLDAKRTKIYSSLYIGSSVIGAILALNELRGWKMARWATDLGDAVSYGLFFFGAVGRYRVESQRVTDYGRLARGGSDRDAEWKKNLADVGGATAIMEMVNAVSVLVFGPSPFTFTLSVAAPFLSSTMMAKTIYQNY